MRYIILCLLFFTTLGLQAQKGSGMFNITFEPSLALGATNDYTSGFHWRGIGFEGRGFITDAISLGGAVGWNVMNQTEAGTFTEGSLSLTGTQYRYINAFPVLANAHYYLGQKGSFRTYFGTGIGLARIEQRTEMGLYVLTINNWHFAVRPEVGIMLPLGRESDLLAAVTFTYAPKNGDSITFSYLGFRLGFSFGQ